MSGTTPPPKNDQSIAGNISSVKEKIITTSKLLKVLTRSKKDIESKADENTDLRAKILSLEEKLSSKKDEIEYKLHSDAEQNAQTIKTLQEKLAILENKNSITEKALTSNKMYTQQLEAECETLKQEKAETGSSKLRQDLMKKTQEAKNLSNQVKESRKQVEDLNKKVEDLNKKVEEFETENERLDMENMALKMEFEEKEEEPDLSLKVEELQNLLNNANKALSEKSSANAISPVFMNKIKKLKADHTFLRNENKYLKEQIKRKDIILSKHQNLEDLLRSSSEDDYEDVDVDFDLNPSSNSSNNTTTERQLNKSATSPLTRRSSSKCSDYSMGESYLSPARRTSFTDKNSSPSQRRTSSSSGSKSSTSSAFRSSLTKPKIAMNDSYVIDLDPPSTGNEPPANIGPTERLPASSALKEKSITPAKGNKAESVNRTTSITTGKAAFRTAGLEVPAPKISVPVTTTGVKQKKPKSKLAKFVNSRNPSKVIDSRPLISHTTPKKRALSPEKPVSVESPTSGPANERSVALGVLTKPAIGAPLPVQSSRSLASASSTSEALIVEEPAPKKIKLATYYADVVKRWVSTKYVVSSDDFDEKKVNECLEEIKLNYTSMKSASDPDSKGDVRYGIDSSFWIEVPGKIDGREKAYALLLSLAAHRKPEYLDHIYNSLYNELKASLKSKRPDTSCARYSRLLCTICKSTSALERIRTVCYDIIRHSACPKNSIICLYNIASGWKDVLTVTNKNNTIMDALQVCCHVIAHDNKTPANIKIMYEKMALTCNWPNSTETVSLEVTTQKVFEELLQLQNEENKVISRRKCFQILKSFELIFYTMDCWKKLYNNFILEKMWPLLSNDNLSEMALEIMATLGTFGLSVDPTKSDKPGVQQLFDLMMQVFTVDTGMCLF
ncbi:hypothetical protein BDF21DRAFT_406766 [Thamnidium elegans]|nr:hypothetical protein BDF21DRAFT_406766 [Thamnidium elegans]